MLDTSFPRFRSSKSAILSQVVAVVVSTGINYLLASNLGLLTRFNTLPDRSPAGRVKVVELTPAEKTRVPVAVTADPLMPPPVNPSSTTVPPFGQGNQAVGVLPVPSVTPNSNRPTKSNSFNPKTTSKNPNKLSSKGLPVTRTKTSKPGKLPIPIKNKTALPTSLDSEPSQTPGGKSSPNPTPTNLDEAPTSPTSSLRSSSPTSETNTSSNSQNPSEDLKTAFKNSTDIIKGLPPGPIITGGKLSSQSYPPNKFKITPTTNNDGYMVILVSVEPNQESNQLVTDIKKIAQSNNLKKLAASLQPQKLIDTIITEPSFQKLTEQAKQKAQDGYKKLKPQPSVAYYQFPIPFSASAVAP